jgi:hypothetical protein
MSSGILLEKEEQEQQLQLESGIPLCGANLSSPVVDQAKYIDEIHYRIGNKVAAIANDSLLFHDLSSSAASSCSMMCITVKSSVPKVVKYHYIQ